MGRKGLTLIELLIVFGIIAVLAGIVLVAFVEIRWRADVSHCSSNLRQIGLALRMYAQDWNGFAPPYCTTGVIASEPNLSNLILAAFRPYTKDDNLWLCPQDFWRGLEWKGIKYQGAYGSISYQVAPRYCSSMPFRIDHPHPVLPKDILRRQCAICISYINITRWFYAIDDYHDRILKPIPGGSFLIVLLLNGRVLARWWHPNLHGCPAKELPSNWPPDSYKDIP